MIFYEDIRKATVLHRINPGYIKYPLRSRVYRVPVKIVQQPSLNVTMTSLANDVSNEMLLAIGHKKGNRRTCQILMVSLSQSKKNMEYALLSGLVLYQVQKPSPAIRTVTQLVRQTLVLVASFIVIPAHVSLIHQIGVNFEKRTEISGDTHPQDSSHLLASDIDITQTTDAQHDIQTFTHLPSVAELGADTTQTNFPNNWELEDDIRLPLMVRVAQHTFNCPFQDTNALPGIR